VSHRGASFDLSGRIAIVTGGSAGIGFAIAEALARAGASVTIAARNQERLDNAALKIARRTGRRVDAVPCDTGSQAEVDRLVASVIEFPGTIDILVNCAANPSGITGNIEMLDAAQLLSDLDVKVVGYARCMKAVAPIMKRRRDGRIVNIGGFTGRTSNTISGLRNAAIAHLTKTVSDQLGPYNITVNALHPGIVHTPHLEELFEAEARSKSVSRSEIEEAFVADTPIRRIIGTDEVAEAVMYLVSGAGGGISGQSVTIDGGFTRGIYL